MDFLQQERTTLVDPARNPRQLDPEVAETLRRFGEEKKAWNTQKGPTKGKGFFFGAFFFFEDVGRFAPKKEVDTLIHLWMINDQLFHVEMQKNDRR